MVLATNSFHLFGITPLICTPSLIRNLRTTFAHPTRRKNLSLHSFGQEVLFWTPICRDFWKIFFALHLSAMGAVFWTPKSSKNIYPSTNSHWESPNAHPFWEKIFISSLICNGKGCFLSLFWKFPLTCSHRAPANYRVFLKSSLTNSHREMRIVHPVLKNRHKKRRLSFDKRQTNC